MINSVEEFEARFGEIDVKTIFASEDARIKRYNVRFDEYARNSKRLTDILEQSLKNALDSESRASLARPFRELLNKVRYVNQMTSFRLLSNASTISQLLSLTRQNILLSYHQSTINDINANTKAVNGALENYLNKKAIEKVTTKNQSKKALLRGKALFGITIEVLNESEILSSVHENLLVQFIELHIQEVENSDLMTRTKHMLIEAQTRLNEAITPLNLMGELVEMVASVPMIKPILHLAKAYLENREKHPLHSVEPTENSYEQGIILLNSELETIENRMNVNLEFINKAHQTVNEVVEQGYLSI